ncbi:MAG TPA: preprotein translocase subunit SecE [Patescibacteria group bacterium]|nr:preprotein translocase subunit SecE [Patescibacteria group bacterium]
MNLTQNKLVNYLSESKQELKKVTWPTKKETIKHTLIVIGLSLFVAAFLGILDFIFSKILAFFL